MAGLPYSAHVMVTTAHTVALLRPASEARRWLACLPVLLLVMFMFLVVYVEGFCVSFIRFYVFALTLFTITNCYVCVNTFLH